MKQSINRRGWQWLMLLALFAWLVPQQAAADGSYTTYVDMSYNYGVSLDGANTVKIHVPVYVQDGITADCWIKDGKLKVSWEDNNKVTHEMTLFEWKATEDISGSAEKCWTTFSTEADGYINVTLGNTSNSVRVTKGGSVGGDVIRNNDDAQTYDVTAIWYVPYNVLGQKLNFKWDVKRNGNGRSEATLTIPAPDAITMPSAGQKVLPVTSSAMLSNKKKGMIEVPWFLSSTDITAIHYEYKDDNKNVIKVPMPTNEHNGVILLDATVPHKDFRIIASYRIKGEKDSYYEIEGAQSPMDDLTMIHAPQGLYATVIAGSKPKVEVKWNVGHLDSEDFAITDFFEVQRSLTGKEEDFVTIGQETFTQASKKSNYTFVDSTIVESIKKEMLVNGGTLDNLTYRVRRTISQIWGWDRANNCATSASCVVDNLHLLRFNDYSAKWEDERSRTVRVSWNYADEYNGVWDDRAKMILHITTKNRAGQIVDDRKIELNSDERQQRYKIVNLSRSCVTYDIEMYVDRSKSPINQMEDVKEFFFPIRTASDWLTFNKKVEDAKGGYNVNARLYADITVDAVIGWNSSSPYCGTFDGNGHTLTVNYNGSSNSAYNNRFIAPFRYVGNAAFRNLHIAGNISTNERNVAGLIAYANSGSTIYINNCRSSVTINSSYNGNTDNGGFISRQTGATVIIRNSKFDGSFVGDNSKENGGFVGWVARGSSLTIENCVFAPERITTKLVSCQTWAVLDTQDVNYSNINSYALCEYSAIVFIRNANDWTTFKNLVEASKNQYDVDARLEADISLNSAKDIAGYSGNYPYRGTFDGNGHTITLNISDNARRTGLFSHVANATFKNLHLAGTVSSSQPSMGSLIGIIDEGYTVTIENCHSSVTLKNNSGNDACVGGFVGIIDNSSTNKLTFRNCKFDGSFEGNSSSNGGFVGWANGSVIIDNCLFAPDHISTKFDNCETWVRHNSNATVTLTNSHATKEYGTVEIVTIDGKPFMVLRSNNDWLRFKAQVEKNANTNAILDGDFTTTDTGSWTNYFSGIFDGNGHTITANIEGGSTDNVALFRNVRDCTIKNLHVKGTIKGGHLTAGLIGNATVSSSSARNKVSNCRVSANIVSTSYSAGGIIGRGNYTDVTNCRFDGSIECQQYTSLLGRWAGVIYGMTDSWTVTAGVQNCLDQGQFKGNFDNRGMNIKPWTVWGNGENQWCHDNYTYNDLTGSKGATSTAGLSLSQLVNKLGNSNWEIVDGIAVPKMAKTSVVNPWSTMSASEMLAILGADYWKIVEGKVVPINKTSLEEISEADIEKYLGNSWTKEDGVLVPVTTTVAEPSTEPIDVPTLKDLFYHTSNGKIDETLVTETRQSSVVLAWDTDGNPIDFFTVLRREVGQTDADWKVIVDSLDDLSYEDKTVSPIKKYEYKVRATNDCEGVTYSETKVTAGQCKNTGRVTGYVRFNDGTGASKVKVGIYNQETNEELTYVTTDATGRFVADELPYKNGGESTTYRVQPKDIKTKDGEDAWSVTFDSEHNDRTIRDFVIINGKRFSGLVWYEGTSIPVKGARFLVNNMEIYNSAGKPVETEYDGSFSFRVREGRDTIKVVMDGHEFVNDGYFKGPNGHDFTADVDGIYLYDATKVKLIGRVVGGNIQGRLPLGNNLSANNLGDSLRMVLTLEGDNSSFLVFDNTNRNKTQRETVYEHGGGHQTHVTTLRKRMEVAPDPITGEYMLKLPPVRWKVQQVYCKGYPTLFQEDQVSEVIDLSDCLADIDTTYVGTYTDVDGQELTDPKATYNAIYNRIYRSPIELTYKQQGFDSFDFFGDKNYTATNMAGNRAVVPLAYKGEDGLAAYTFGYPVFSLERKYYIEMQLAESYRYNNDPTTELIDLVPVSGGTVTMQNAMKANSNREILPLDENGQAVFELGVDQTTQLLSGENALKTVTFSAEQDGTIYQARPLRGFVLNMFPLGTGVDVMTNGQPLLFDILRDPPGSKSTATLSEGSTFNFSYKMDLTTSAGVKFTAITGDKTHSYLGTVTAPAGAGTTSGDLFTAENGDATASEFVFNLKGEKAYSYTMTTHNDITTSSVTDMVGADADLYIGVVQNIQVMPMSTIRALPDSMYQHMAGRVGLTTGEGPQGVLGMFSTYGSMIHIAEGYDAQGNKFHLVRDESLAYGPKLESQFIYSQKQILTQIIPGLAKDILELMYLGTESEAQALANSTKRPVYLSLRSTDDPMFGLGNALYNTTVREPNDSTHYLIVLPNPTDQNFTDEVSEKNALITGWSMMIAQNEYEKLSATDLVANYDVAGAQSVSYSESFETNFTNATMLHFPFSDDPVFFEEDEDKDASQMLGEQIVEAILKALQTVEEEEPGKKMDPEKEKEEPTGSESEVGFGGIKFKWKLTPVLASECLGTYGSGKAYSRKESFSIVPDPLSHLNVDVFRVALPDFGEEEEEEEEFELIPDDPSSRVNDNSDLETIFMSDKFKKEQKHILKQLEQEVVQMVAGPQGFVYRTRGGATCNPWEDERRTKIYKGGLVLDERTLKIHNLKISLDKQSVSGVSVNDAARFTVYLANESEKPEAIRPTDGFILFADDTSNPNGAKIYVDGQALTGNGVYVSLIPGVVTEKTIEVRAGTGFDFEGLRIGLMSPTDASHTTEYVSFDVHYLREAGMVNIAMPGDKWVINTFAQQDPKRGWYIPVTINGFDKYQHNFDHIEFQYKESQRGDDSWTNLCSYYADSTLMANANGVCELIPENGNIVTQFYGEGWVMEKPYDLRAVLYCRNGSSFLTTSSPIISGVKDTRRPQLFGTPEPKSGLLTLNNDIIFNFSEDIEYNYLRAGTNFEVRGEVNNSSISENVSIQFTGKASVESEAKRNFSGKNLTVDLMVKPAETGRDMPLFSHGTNGKKLQLWLTEDFKLKAVVNDTTFTSKDAVKKGTFTEVALVMDQTTKKLTLYNDGDVLGTFDMKELYDGTGTLIFGRTNENDRTDSKFYEGRMMEARLWYRTMDGGLLSTTYGKRRLTGYEKDLVDYYPMNEGSGDYATDHTQGAHAKLIGASWAIPRGMSLRLENDDHGIELDENTLNRTQEQDYTMMFWFKTDSNGRGVLVSNGAGIKSEDGAKDIFNIAFEAEKLMYRSNGFAIQVPGDWSDNQWHHYAMTVNRAHNVANIYIDKELRTSFETDSLGGINGGTPLFGAARYKERDAEGNINTIDTNNWLTGNIDEFCLFSQALPQTLINTYATKSPNGDEAGLLTYLGFDRQELQGDNDMVMVPYVYSKVLERDENGNIVYERDPETQKPTQIPARRYEFIDTPDVILNHIDQTLGAPVLPYEELANLKYSFIGKDNQIMIELDEPATKLNHRNIYVTVYDVEDKYGNTLASPQTASYLVTNSRLQWLVNRLDVTIKYGSGESCELPFYNDGARSHTYIIENCPKWLTLNKYSDAVAPQTADFVTATVSKDLGIGTYNEIIYLTDEEGITEPFYLNLTVEGEQPEWAKNINSDLLQNSMSISGLVYLYDELDTDSRDIVGAFDNEGVCHGYANIDHNAQTGETGLYLTVYDNETSGRELNFRLWQYSTGREIVLKTTPAIKFEKSAVLGTDTPVRFDGGDSFVQNFSLKKGWNWVSFNVQSESLFNLNKLLSSISWTEGDMLTDLGSNLTLTYKDQKWLASGQTQNIIISSKKSYAIKVQKDCTFPVEGAVIKQEDARTIKVKKGWNSIGYTPVTNLTVETALSDYFDNAEDGDVIKSHTEFAYFTKSGNSGRWRGSLQYMKPGEGYMMLRKADGDAKFTYPYYEPGSNFNEDASSSTSRAAAVLCNTMSVSAVVEGFETEEGDILLAYTDGEVVGEHVLLGNSDPAYLSIAGESEQPIWFAIEREGKIVAMTSEVMSFTTNAVIGSPDEPTTINFARTAYEDGKWYTVGGLMLPQKPTKKGLYIYNGKKVVIK